MDEKEIRKIKEINEINEIKQIINTLNKYNVKFDENISNDKNIYDEIKKIYEDAKEKYFIREKNYNIVISENFKYKYPFLSKIQKKAIEDIKDRILFNKTIQPYLSSNHYIEKASKKDELLVKYKIYHLHLGMPGKNIRHVKRSNKLLFITYDESNVYFLDLKKHPIGDEWNCEDLLEIKKKLIENNEK